MSTNLLSLYKTYKNDIDESVFNRIKKTQKSDIEEDVDSLMGFSSYEEVLSYIKNRFPSSKIEYSQDVDEPLPEKTFFFEPKSGRRICRFTFSSFVNESFSSMFRFMDVKSDNGDALSVVIKGGNKYCYFSVIVSDDGDEKLKTKVSNSYYDDEDNPNLVLEYPVCKKKIDFLMGCVDDFIDFYDNSFDYNDFDMPYKSKDFLVELASKINGGLNESVFRKVKSSSVSDIEEEIDSELDLSWEEKFFYIIKKVGVIGVEKWRGYSLERPSWGYVYPCYIKTYKDMVFPLGHEVVYHEMDYAHYIPKGKEMVLDKCLCMNRNGSDVYLRGIEWKAQTTINKDGKIVDIEPIMWFDFVMPQKSKSGKSCRYIDVSDSLKGLEYYYGKDGVKRIYEYCCEIYRGKLNESVFNKVKRINNRSAEDEADNLISVVNNFQDFYEYFRNAQKNVLKDFKRVDGWNKRDGWGFRMMDCTSNCLEFGFEYQDKFQNFVNVWFCDKKQFESENSFDEDSDGTDGIIIEMNLVTKGSSSQSFKLIDSDFKIGDYEDTYTWINYSDLNGRFLQKIVKFILDMERYCRQNYWETPITGDLDLEDSTEEDLDDLLFDIFLDVVKMKGLNESVFNKVKKTKGIEEVIDNSLVKVENFSEFSDLFFEMSKNILGDVKDYDYFSSKQIIIRNEFAKIKKSNFFGFEYYDKNSDSIGLEIDESEHGFTMLIYKNIKENCIDGRLSKDFSEVYHFDDYDIIPYKDVDKVFMDKFVDFIRRFKETCLKKYSEEPIKEFGYMAFSHYDKMQTLRNFVKISMR